LKEREGDGLKDVFQVQSVSKSQPCDNLSVKSTKKLKSIFKFYTLAAAKTENSVQIIYFLKLTHKDSQTPA
jgi:hypothetical protein